MVACGIGAYPIITSSELPCLLLEISALKEPNKVQLNFQILVILAIDSCKVSANPAESNSAMWLMK
jgi:hypothetical protein